jgi:hypothetical protein
VSTKFGVFFLSPGGFFLLGRDLDFQYIGAAVENLLKPLGYVGVPQITSAQVLATRNEIRWTLKPVGTFTPAGYVTDGGGVVVRLDYTDLVATDTAQTAVDKLKWSTFSNYYAADAVVWNGNYTVVGSDNIVKVDSEATNFDQATTTQGIGAVIETGWLRLKGVQDYQRVKRLVLTGASNSAPHTFTGYLAFDYDPNFRESFTIGPLAPNEPWEARHRVAFKQKCEAIKLRLVASAETNAKWSIENLGLEIGLKKGLVKLPASSTF